MPLETNKEWRYWGRKDPLWAVARFEGKSATGPSAWSSEDFLALGAADFADVKRHWMHYGLLPDRVVEIGCGAGRMTNQLAATFGTVLALDVSSEQIARAQDLLGARGANVTFAVTDDPVIPAADRSCTAMFSCHVFQHLPGMAAIEAYLRESLRILVPGGTVCFHLPSPGAHLSSPQSPLWYTARNLYKRIKRALGRRALAEYHRYPAPAVIGVLQRIGFARVELRVFAMSSNGDYHSYFFATKP